VTLPKLSRGTVWLATKHALSFIVEIKHRVYPTNTPVTHFSCVWNTAHPPRIFSEVTRMHAFFREHVSKSCNYFY
jgi:hypothetical protein